MARPNKPRTLGSERTLAQRIEHERKLRDWTYDALARNMAAVGCPIQPSALQKIEKGDPPRRITVDEHVALANVFELPMDELLVPIARVMSDRARSLVQAWVAKRDELARVTDQERLLRMAIEAHLEDRPDSRAAVEAELNTWARTMDWPDVDEGVTFWSLQLRRVPHDSEEFQAFLEGLGRNG